MHVLSVDPCTGRCDPRRVCRPGKGGNRDPSIRSQPLIAGAEKTTDVFFAVFRASFDRLSSVFRHHEGLIKGHHSSIVLGCLRGAVNWVPIMPREPRFGKKTCDWFCFCSRAVRGINRLSHTHVFSLHSQKSFRNLIKSTRNQILFAIFTKYLPKVHVFTKYLFDILLNHPEIRLYLQFFRSIWIQTDTVCLDPNQYKNGKYNLILVWFNKISKIFFCVSDLNNVKAYIPMCANTETLFSAIVFTIYLKCHPVLYVFKILDKKSNTISYIFPKCSVEI